jgi:hypothetical protein
VVSRGGRPDLARPRLAAVTAPTLLIVGGRDEVVLDLNRRAQAELRCENDLAVVPGASHLFEEPGTLDAAEVERADLLDGISCTGQECAAVGGYCYGTSAEHAPHRAVGGLGLAGRAIAGCAALQLGAGRFLQGRCRLQGRRLAGNGLERGTLARRRYRRLSDISTCWRASKSSTHLPVPSTTDSSGLPAR